MPCEMPPSLIINPTNGSVQIDGVAQVINRGLSRDLAASTFAQFYRTSVNHGNGYEWLAFQGVSFGGHPCGFSLGFNNGLLEQVHWSVALPNAKMERGWPMREAIDAEVNFVRMALTKIFSRSFSSGQERFPWGSVWCFFDAKGFQASSGVRYAA